MGYFNFSGYILLDFIFFISFISIKAYKTEQREKKANNLDSKDNSKRRRAQMVLFEKIGDEASKLEFNEIALRYYNKMMKFSLKNFN